MNQGQKLPSIPTWKLKHDLATLKEKATDEATFNRGYRMMAVSPGELKFPSWPKCYERGVTLEDLRRRTLPAYIGVDLSSKNRPGNAIIAVGLDPVTQRRAFLGVRYGAWTSPQTAGALAEESLLHNVQYIQVENNAYQQSLIDWVQQEKANFPYWMKIEAFTTGTGKADPQYGLPGLEVEFKNGAWIFPYEQIEGHPTTCACDWCHLDREFRLYPRGATADGVMACVGEGARVTTARGMIPIEDVVIGDFVLTHRARWRRVTEVFSRDYDGEVVRVKPWGGMPFLLTPEHPAWAANAGFYREDRTNRLVPQVWSFVPAGELRAGRKTAGQYVFTPVPEAWPGEAIEPKIPGFLAGLYLAEGFLSGAPHQVCFAFHEREGYLADYVAREAERIYGARTAIRHRGDRGMVVYFSSRIAALEFAVFRKGQAKALPWSWMAAPDSYREQVARGWFVGDGNLYEGRLHGVSISRDLLGQVGMTLMQRGYLPRIGPHELGGRVSNFGGRLAVAKESWRMSLSRTDTAQLLAGAGAEEIARWGVISGGMRERTNSAGLGVVDGVARKLRSVDPEFYRGTVRNLHVEEDESYVVEGVAVHNCWFARDALNKWAPRPGATGGAGLGRLNMR